MKIAVLMSVYRNDTKGALEEAVKSVLRQTFSEFDFHIQCDGVIDKECKNYLNSLTDKRIHIYQRTENYGLAYSLNELISRVTSLNYDFYARMDADDICFEDRFEKQIAFLQGNNLDIVGGQIIEFGINQKDIISKRVVPCHHDEMVNLMKFRSPFSHPTIIMRAKVMETLKGYDYEIFPEDYEFFVRAYLQGFKFGNVPGNVLWFRLGEDLSAAIKRRWGWNYAKNEFKLYRKFLNIGFFNLFDFARVVLLKIPLRLIPFNIFRFIYFRIAR